jgi:membrane-associated protease RseP (regulator of RpoE activity)
VNSDPISAGVDSQESLAPTQFAEIKVPSNQGGHNRREWLLPSILFAATLLSTTFAGLFYIADVGFGTLLTTALVHPGILLLGLPFSLTLITILLAHELGHYFACRHYRIRCTPPFFIPLPVSIAGTLGAFIRIKSPFQHKRALFDVGVAGPLAGFAFALPALFLGIGLSRVIPRGQLQGAINFGEPLLFRWVGKLLLGYSPADQDMLAHPIAMAAWFGLLATCLNLFPIWQLDGGHISYAIFGRKAQRKISIFAAGGLVLISFLGWPLPSYLVFGAILLIFGIRYRFYHPPTLYDEEEIGSGRIAFALLTLLILLVSFTPVPISIS